MKVLILGASGQIAQWVVDMLRGDPDVEMTLYLRDPRKLRGPIPANAHVVQGDVRDKVSLGTAMKDQDVVYANLAGDVDLQAGDILTAMDAADVSRLIFVTSLGIYDEVPGKFGEWNRREIGSFLPPYRRAADLIERSSVEYAILRPAWLTDKDEIDFETTERAQAFRGTEVSRKSVAALAVELLKSNEPFGRQNIGVSKPGTDGDRPAFL